MRIVLPKLLVRVCHYVIILMFSVLSLNLILTRFLFECAFKTEFCYSAFLQHELSVTTRSYEGWNFNSGNYLFTTDTK